MFEMSQSKTNVLAVTIAIYVATFVSAVEGDHRVDGAANHCGKLTWGGPNELGLFDLLIGDGHGDPHLW